MLDSLVFLFFSKEARAPRNYKREYEQYHSKPERVDERSTRNKARRKLGLTKGDPREVDHKIPLSKGGSNARSNLRAVSLVNNRKKFTKTASNHHHLITGHSGAGKSTLARKLSEETGSPIVALDDVPSIRAILDEQKAIAKASGGKLDLSPETVAKHKAIELKAIQDAIAAKNPSIIEGSYLLDHDPSMFKGHKMMLVDRDRNKILDQRVERQRLKDIGRGREWSDERASGVRSRGEQLLNHYQPGVDTWRSSSLVEKKAHILKEGFDPRLTMWLLKKQKSAKSPKMKKFLGGAADMSNKAVDASIDMYAKKPETRAGRMLKATKDAVQDINDGTNPAMATTTAKMRFAADSGMGQGIQEAGQSVAKGGKLMAETSDSIPRKVLGRTLQGAGNITAGAGWTTKTLPDWIPSWAPV